MQESRSRLSVASTSSTSTCSSTGSGQVPATALQDSKYSSLSSLSDTESVGKDFRVVVTGKHGNSVLMGKSGSEVMILFSCSTQLCP